MEVLLDRSCVIWLCQCSMKRANMLRHCMMTFACIWHWTVPSLAYRQPGKTSQGKGMSQIESMSRGVLMFCAEAAQTGTYKEDSCGVGALDCLNRLMSG